MIRLRKLPYLLSLAGLYCSPSLHAASFDIANGVTLNSTQTLNANETGVILSGGVLSVAGVAIVAPGNNVTVSNSGSIATTGNNAYAIDSEGTNATISNSGSIATTGSSAYGILSFGANAAVISNSGSIATMGGGALGIGSNSANATISNSGSIATAGNGAYGIYSEGANATIGNSGSITTAWNGTYGIYSTGANATISSSGSIATAGNGAHGIYAFANASNSGSIATTGSGAYGIYSSNASNSGSIATTGSGAYGIFSAGVISNSGSITTTGFNGVGIVSTAANTAISNSGSIATTGNSALGIGSTGANATISSSGTIATAGADSVGIYSEGANATIGNSGSIATAGNGAHGIYSTGANATISNSGSIATTGNAAYGIASIGDNTTLSNSGSISVTGVNSIGIMSGGANSTINLSGRVSATYAIVGGNNQTLNLLPGAAVIGAIDLGHDTNHVNVVLNSGGPSATMSITNPGTITQSGKGLSFVSGSTVSIVDTTNLTANQASMGFASMNQFQAVNQQLDQVAPPPQPIKVAATELTPGMLHQDQGPTAWGHVFGGENQRDGNGAALGYTDNGYGLIGGYEQTLGDHRVGVFGGLSRSTLKTEIASAKTDNDSAFLGLYGQYAAGDWTVNGALALGHINADTDRQVVDNVYGYQTAQSGNHTTYLSPSVAVTRAIDLGAGISLRPSAQLNYTYGRVSGYTESGTTRSNLSVGSHDASVLNTRLQVAVRQTFAEHQGEFEVRLGATRSDFGNDKVKINLQGVGATHYGLTGTDNVSGGFVGAGGRLTLKNQLSLVGNVEYTQGSGDNHAAAGYVGLEYQY